VVLIGQRLFLETIKKYCAAHGITLEVRSGGWLIIMQRKSERRLAIGYDVGLNSAVAHQVANDKAATSDVLTLAGISCIAHTLFLGEKLRMHVAGSGSRERMLQLLDAHPNGLVVKPNEGTSGECVFRVNTTSELDAAAARIFNAYPSLAVSPYVEIDDEVRVVVLDDRAMVVYAKQRPSVMGDGRHSLRELALAATAADRHPALQSTMAEDFDRAALDAIVPAGERRIFNWRHNLDSGAEPLILESGEVREACAALALRAARAIRIRFTSIDVVRVGSEWQVLEVNSGVKMEELGRRRPDLVQATYEAALDKVFGSGSQST